MDKITTLGFLGKLAQWRRLGNDVYVHELTRIDPNDLDDAALMAHLEATNAVLAEYANHEPWKTIAARAKRVAIARGLVYGYISPATTRVS